MKGKKVDKLGILDALFQYNEIINVIPGCLYWKDLNGRYLGCNDLTAQLAGLSSSHEIIGKTDQELWGQEAENLLKNDAQAISSGEAVFVEEQLNAADGRRIYFTGVKVPLKDQNDNIVGIIGNSLDITELKHTQAELKKAKEQAEAANVAKSLFIANMSHDIRTPLSGVINLAKMLEKEGDTEKDREYGQVIHHSSERLMSLLNEILSIVSLDEAQEDRLEIETFQLQDYLTHFKALFSPITKTRNVTLEIDASSDLPDYVQSDCTKLDRILLNLLGNALKFTENGYVRLSAKLLSKKDKKIMVEMKVEDSGIGISPDKIEQIFDRFYRGTPSYEGKYEGYGIGLFIVKKFVTLLGGTIKVESQVDKGTAFNLVTPMIIGNKKDIKAARLSDNLELPNKWLWESVLPLPSKPSLEKNKDKQLVLFIEDDPIAKHTGQYFLESINLNVYAVTNGEEALKAAKSLPFDLIVSDIGLPGIDGNEFTLLYRHWENTYRKMAIPIIGLSAHVSDEIKHSSIDVGMSLVLEKPLNDQKLAQIKRILSTSTTLFHSTKEKQGYVKLEPCGLGADLPGTEEELFQLDHYPLLDQQKGIETVGTEEMLKETLALLVESISEELTQMEKAHSIGDWNSLQKIAHKLKGGALYVGTVRMQYACQYLERYRLAGHHHLLEKLYSQLIEVLQLTYSRINTYLRS